MEQAINTASTTEWRSVVSLISPVIKNGDLQVTKTKYTAEQLAKLGITKYNVRKRTAQFMGVSMAVDTAVTLSGDPDNVKKSETQAVDSDRKETDKRLEKPLAKIGADLTKLLANGSGLLPSDLGNIRYEIGTDGTVDASFRHAGKPRTGEPNIKYGGFTGGELKSHNVVQFVKLAPNASANGWLKAPIATVTSGAAMCEVDQRPYAGQKDSDANHKWAGCERSTCTANCHGDNADRGATYGKRTEYGARGWHIELADGSRTNLADVDWDVTA